MTNINNNWLPPGTARKETINPKLDQLLEEAAKLLREKKTNPNQIKQSLINLMSFLCTEEGRTDRNCTATDSFFCLHDDNGFDWQHLPKPFQLILGDIGGQLHDTITSPEIAKNFESTPEQLLERLKQLTI